MYVIKAIYPLGGHTVSFGGETLRFQNKQEATDRAEMLNATEKMNAARNMRLSETRYIVVEEAI